MPQLGETVTEGTIIRWLKHEGEQISQDEPLFEVSTDKVDSEVPSPVAGVLREILVPEGETVDVGARLAVVGDARLGASLHRPRRKPSRSQPPAPLPGSAAALRTPVDRRHRTATATATAPPPAPATCRHPPPAVTEAPPAPAAGTCSRRCPQAPPSPQLSRLARRLGASSTAAVVRRSTTGCRRAGGRSSKRQPVRTKKECRSSRARSRRWCVG